MTAKNKRLNVLITEKLQSQMNDVKNKHSINWSEVIRKDIQKQIIKLTKGDKNV